MQEIVFINDLRLEQLTALFEPLPGVGRRQSFPTNASCMLYLTYTNKGGVIQHTLTLEDACSGRPEKSSQQAAQLTTVQLQ